MTITERESGARLDEALAARIPTVSRMRLKMLLDQNRVRVNGESRPAGWRLAAGDSVEVEIDSGITTATTPEPIPIAVLYEDADLLVVDKAAGMVVHPAGRHQSGTLANALAYHFNVAGAADPPIRPGLVHRLDRATSGLMVVAKTQAALSRLTVQFQRRAVEKRYAALVHGSLAGSGLWEAPIGADREALPRWGIRESGRPASTRFEVMEQLTAHTLLELEPVTGRTNQLRLHAAHFGHPIAGDELFGRGAEPDLERLFLHAERLAFTHPTTGERCEFRSGLPEVLEAYLALLRG